MGLLDALFGRRNTGPLEQHQVTRRVVQALQAGTLPAEIELDLIEQGIPSRQARRLVTMAVDVHEHGVHLFDQSD